MSKITSFLTKEEYIKIIRNYLLSRSSYYILSIILIGIVSYATISTLYQKNIFDIKALVIWWILTIFYTILIPSAITLRSKIIYQNTSFFHKEMSFTITKDSILWETSAGSKSIPFTKIYRIETNKYALILSLSPYQVLAIPFKDISQKAWDDIKLYSQVLHKHAKIKDTLYQQSQQLRGN